MRLQGDQYWVVGQFEWDIGVAPKPVRGSGRLTIAQQFTAGNEGVNEM
jgi:hypothetical protein